jgi:predicted glycoside hydrolase/deacetylase ChbG (UPF0249 family)
VTRDVTFPCGLRRLIVNADDFGQSAGINEGIIQCHEQGVVTSASLMVRWPSAADAAAYARRQSTMSVGLHLDFGEWVHNDHAWRALYKVVDSSDPDAVRTEIDRQLDAFRRLMQRDPTHIDAHQHVHRAEPAWSIVIEASSRLGVPCRDPFGHAYRGEFYGQDRDGRALDRVITVDHFVEMLHTLPGGTTEISCHPGLRGDAPGMYVAERAVEVRVLCDPHLRSTIEAEGVDLISFRDLA